MLSALSSSTRQNENSRVFCSSIAAREHLHMLATDWSLAIISLGESHSSTILPFAPVF